MGEVRQNRSFLICRSFAEAEEASEFTPVLLRAHATLSACL